MRKASTLIVALLITSQYSSLHGEPLPETKIAVWNINLCDNKKCHDGQMSYAGQIGHIADTVVSLSGLKNPPLKWDLIGLSEAFAHRKGDWIFGVGWNIRYVADEIKCHETANSILTIPCFDSHLRNSAVPEDWSDQRGEVGLLANSDVFTKSLGGYHRNLSTAVSGLAGRVRRDLLGHRFIIKSQGYVLPFYSTHLTGERLGELEDLLDAITDWWQAGDLTPLVVGDFNFSAGSPSLFGKMSEYFTLIGTGSGASNRIEQIWVGKTEKFPGSLGAIQEARWEYLTEFRDVAADLSDHAVPYAELKTPSEDCLRIAPNTLRIVSRNGKYYIATGPNIILLDFPNAAEANEALALLQGYSIDKHCFVGRPNTDFTYYLASNASPSGARPNEDCLPINSTALIVRRDNGIWKIMQGNNSVQSFGQYQGAAYRALSLIKHYAFTQHCFVGRPNPGMEYWRR